MESMGSSIENLPKMYGVEKMTEHSKKCEAAWKAWKTAWKAAREAWKAAREAREACPKCKELSK